MASGSGDACAGYDNLSREADDLSIGSSSGEEPCTFSWSTACNRVPPMSFELAHRLDEDREFDRHLPKRLRVKSALHFTPVEVARHAARLLAPVPGMTILDVGAGPGKFCTVAAREVPDTLFVGIELRPHLVLLARSLAAHHELSNARFLHGDALDLDWGAYDGFYFFNPFAEQSHHASLRIDRTLPETPNRFLEYVNEARRRLSIARLGTRVVTYHSLGAPIPASYDLVFTEAVGSDRLELWIKSRRSGGNAMPRAGRA